MLKDVKGLTRTVGGSGVGLSSVRVGVRDGVANRECGGGLVTVNRLAHFSNGSQSRVIVEDYIVDESAI